MLYFEMYDSKVEKTSLILVLELILIIQMTAKVCSFLRVYEKFGQLVTLITTCVKDILHFFAFLLIFVIMFAMLYKQFGMVSQHRDGFESYKYFNLFNFVW